MNPSAIPFGLLFEEQAPTPAEKPRPPVYDPAEGLSFVTDATSRHLPYVTEGSNIARTQTVTFQVKETTDVDDPPNSTATFTKIRSEASIRSGGRDKDGCREARPVGPHRRSQEGESWPLLLPTGCRPRQDPFDKAASILAVSAITPFAPPHG